MHLWRNENTFDSQLYWQSYKLFQVYPVDYLQWLRILKNHYIKFRYITLHKIKIKLVHLINWVISAKLDCSAISTVPNRKYFSITRADKILYFAAVVLRCAVLCAAVWPISVIFVHQQLSANICCCVLIGKLSQEVDFVYIPLSQPRNLHSYQFHTYININLEA